MNSDHDHFISDFEDLIEQVFPDEKLGFSVADACVALEKSGHYDPVSMKWNLPVGEYSPKGFEIEVENFLNDMMDVLSELHPSESVSRVFDSRHANIATHLKDCPRKPDIVLVAKDEEVAWGDECKWRRVKALIEFKESLQQMDFDRLPQLAEVARSIFADQPDRRFVLGAVFQSGFVRLGVWSRFASGLVTSLEYDVHRHPEILIRIIAGLAFADDETLGYDVPMSLNTNLRTIKVNGDVYEIIKVIGTNIDKTIFLVAKDGQRYVIKDAWVDGSRDATEYSIMLDLKGCEHVTQLVDHEHVKAGEQKDSALSLFAALFDELPDGFAGHDHIRIVMNPYGRPLESFTCLAELVSGLRDIVSGTLLIV